MKLLVIVAILASFYINTASPHRWSKKILNHRSTHGERCQSGDGSSYRGFVSESLYGNTCLNWKKVKYPGGASKGLGNHNYCRNPDHSSMPWCPVRRGRRMVKEYCDIPTCSTSTVKPPVPKIEDTELTCGERSERRMNKVVGGSFTPIESHPWVSAVFEQRRGFLCGGSLIAPCWVLSAAHCFSDGEHTNIKRLVVYLGKSAINETDLAREQKFTVEKLIIHQKYNDTTYDNDIALLKIKGKDGGCAAKSLTSRTVCLPPPHTQLPAGFQCSVAGFGKERHDAWHYSQYLKQAPVNLISQSECKSELYYKDRITENMFCAASPDWTTDACGGDSGGPLVCEASGRMFLFGVISWGEGCAWKNKPGVYTQVTNYNKWITRKTRLSKYTEGLMYPMK
ncbi:tissue-type plasminogen activator-like [Sphaeramia orbicularis]|uniref:trypsin n=1 Tax=Sphaeramia orbicularis TaxID=375764 RepID=A0A673ALJ9_9TELE|nr:tissue-type plasminogen activator-like [Sphaeramia orbicularis]